MSIFHRHFSMIVGQFALNFGAHLEPRAALCSLQKRLFCKHGFKIVSKRPSGAEIVQNQLKTSSNLWILWFYQSKTNVLCNRLKNSNDSADNYNLKSTTKHDTHYFVRISSTDIHEKMWNHIPQTPHPYVIHARSHLNNISSWLSGACLEGLLAGAVRGGRCLDVLSWGPEVCSRIANLLVFLLVLKSTLGVL